MENAPGKDSCQCIGSFCEEESHSPTTANLRELKLKKRIAAERKFPGPAPRFLVGKLLGSLRFSDECLQGQTSTQNTLSRFPSISASSVFCGIPPTTTPLSCPTEGTLSSVLPYSRKLRKSSAKEKESVGGEKHRRQTSQVPFRSRGGKSLF